MAKAKKPARARTPKPRGKGKAKGVKSKDVAKTVRAARERHRVPAARALPGMEQVRDTTLDRLCRRIGDNTAAANELRTNVEADKQAALDHMLETKSKSYHHHGVELVVRGGTAKLSVRPYKGDTQATVSDGDRIIAGVGDGDQGDGDGEGDE
jgi:hypothetical protein